MKMWTPTSSVVDPDSLNPDPILSESGSRYRSRVLITKNWRKKNSWNYFLFFFWSKIWIYLSLAFIKWHPSYRRSLQPSKENIQHYKDDIYLTIFFFSGPFLPSWIWIAIPECGYGFRSTPLPNRFTHISCHNVTNVWWLEIWSNHDHISWLNMIDVSWVERSNHEHWSKILS